MLLNNKKGKAELDDVDIVLISELQDNGRASLVKLGKRIGLKHSSVRERLLKIIRSNYIKIQANINLKNLGFRVVFVGFEVVGYESTINLMNKLKNCPRTLLIGFTSGEFNVIALMIVEDIDALRIFIERHLRPIANIRRISINFGEIVYPEFIPTPPLEKMKEVTGRSCLRCELFAKQGDGIE